VEHREGEGVRQLEQRCVGMWRQFPDLETQHKIGPFLKYQRLSPGCALRQRPTNREEHLRYAKLLREGAPKLRIAMAACLAHRVERLRPE
jgi:hypothetical protein